LLDPGFVLLCRQVLDRFTEFGIQLFLGVRKIFFDAIEAVPLELQFFSFGSGEGGIVQRLVERELGLLELAALFQLIHALEQLGLSDAI
jgi:hypothetical protein